MQSVTLTVGVIGSILVLWLRPAYALAVYIATLVWYPGYLTFRIGTIDITVGRIVIAVLLLRCLFDNRMRREFVWSRLDTWVTMSMVIYVGMYLVTRPLLPAIENRAGMFMDSWFVYMTARLIVTNKATLISFIKVTSLVLAALAVLGVIESTGHLHPFVALKRFRPWGSATIGELVIGPGRWGFARAIGPFSHAIMFGVTFGMFFPLIWALRHQRDYWGKLAYLLSGMVIAGALSSMSSNAWMMVIFAILFLAMEKYKHWVKLILVLFICLSMFIHVTSNRPFYHVLFNYCDPVGGGWWQRARLIDLGIETFGEWWLLGYGGRDPGWITKSTDLNNGFLLAGVNYGIWGMAAFCGTFVVALRTLARSHNVTNDDVLRSWIWSMGTTLVVIMISLMGVSFFGQPHMLLYCIFGIAGSFPSLVKQHSVVNPYNNKITELLMANGA